MYASDNCRAKLQIRRSMISDVIDMFGKELIFSDENDQNVTVLVYANEMSITHFAQSFAPNVVVLEPENLRKKLKTTLEQSLENYKN